MITINGKDYKELRCSACQKFIVYQNISAGIIYHECPRCHHENEFTFKYLKTRENVERIERLYNVNVIEKHLEEGGE